MSHGNDRRPRARLGLTALEDRSTPASLASTPYAVGVPDGETGDVTVHAADGSVQYTVANPYGSDFTGGVRVALADVTGDGTPDLITAPGPGTAPTIHVFDGSTQQEVASFDAYESTFTGGVYVAAGDITGDGKAEIITGADQGGGPRVVVFDGSTVSGTTTPTALDDFLAIDDSNFRGGVRIALGDVNGDGTSDLVVGAGFGGGPRIAVYDGAALANGEQVKLVNDFFAFEDTLRNGVFPTVGDLNGDGCGDLIFGAGPGGGPRVLALDGAAALAGSERAIANFFAGGSGSRDGVQVGVVTDGSGSTSIVSTDLSSGTTTVSDSTGTSTGTLAGASGGPVCGTSDDSSGSTGSSDSGSADSGSIAVTSDTAAAVRGSYTGSGSGTLAVYSGTTAAPTVSTADATITLDITDATPVTLPVGHRRHGGSASTDESSSTGGTANALELSGTIAVSVAGADPITLSVHGTFVLTADPATSGTVQGVLRLSVERPEAGATPSGLHLSLAGTLDGGSLTVDRLVVIDATNRPAGSVFASPTAADADKIVLTRA
jgi:hypothetical protein